MTATVFDFQLSPELEAHEPPEPRDNVRLLLGGPDGVSHHRFTDLPTLLLPGDVLVVNTSATMPAAVSTTDGLDLHFSTELPDGTWVVEPRKFGGMRNQRLDFPGGMVVQLLEPYTDRLWIARVNTDVPSFLMAHGRPIRYSYVEKEWPLSAYQTVFGTELGSAEMPSASRPFTESIVAQLVSQGIVLAPITLHTGVASHEAHELPYPERFRVPAETARLVNRARRVIAIGTTAVRAIESAVGPDGTVHAAEGWTDLVITPELGVRVVDGLLTGFHEPRASHLMMLEAIAGPDLLERCYAEAIEGRYLWHEFGDMNLLLNESA